MRSTVVKGSGVVGKHKTSASLEDEFWNALKDIVSSRRATYSSLLSQINERRQLPNLSSAIRLFVLEFYQEQARRAATAPRQHA